MGTTLLWRLAGADTSPANADQLATSLRQHVQHTPVTSTLMQIGDIQQAYVTLAGCAGCAEDRCEIGCYRQLFARILRAKWPTVTLHLVRRGLMARPYTRTLLAWPAADARPLGAALLHPWRDARLVVHWRGRAGQVQSGAVLAVDADGPDPRGMLAALGWKTLVAPAPLGTRLLATGAPVLAQRRWAADILLLAPLDHAVPAPATGASDDGHTPVCTPPMFTAPLWSPTEAVSPGGTSALPTIHLADVPQPERADTALDDVALSTWLRDAVLNAAPASAPVGNSYQSRVEPSAADIAALTVPSETPDADGRFWPQGPAQLPPLDVAALVTQFATDPRPMEATQASQRGLSKKRLIEWFGLSEADAKVWMVWLDAAELLQPVAHKETKWTTTRTLVTDDLETLAAQLRDTPVPEVRDLPVMWGGKQ